MVGGQSLQSNLSLCTVILLLHNITVVASVTQRCLGPESPKWKLEKNQVLSFKELTLLSSLIQCHLQSLLQKGHPVIQHARIAKARVS